MPLLLLLLLLTQTAFAQAGPDLLDRPVALEKTTGTVQDLLRELSRQSGVAFSYSNQLPLGATVTLPRATQPLRAHLDALFAGRRMEYLVRENKIILRTAERPGAGTGGHALSGYVRDAASGEALAGASVYLPARSVGTASNAYGFYSLSLPGGTYRVVVTFVGYRPDTLLVTLGQNQSLSFALQPAATQLDSVTVASPRPDEGPGSVRTGMHQFDMGTLRKLPALAGEVDVMRSLQLLPGVHKAGEGSTGLYVRGGNADQNLVLLDEAPVYNTSHLLGVFSVFHPDIVKDVQLYKGGIPAQYGGRLSSVLDIRMKEGNARKFGVSGGVGLLSSRLTVEGPLVRDKTSFILAARRTYPDLLLLNLNPNISGFRLNFYDLNAKINHTFNARNRLYLSGFFGRDLTQMGGFYNNQRVRWSNATGTLRWNHLFSERLFSNFTLLYSQYRYRLQATPVQWQSRIEDVGAKGDFTWFQSPRSTFRFGFGSTHHRLDPGRSRADTLETGPMRVPGRNALEHTLYLWVTPLEREGP
ncbi:MAG: TonB-dependent receptor [Cytophagales bacterium]|nr:TonB-dependent receptor [Cytophagales bacterium]